MDKTVRTITIAVSIATINEDEQTIFKADVVDDRMKHLCSQDEHATHDEAVASATEALRNYLPDALLGERE